VLGAGRRAGAAAPGAAGSLALGDKLTKYRDNLDMLRDLLDARVDVTDLTDTAFAELLAAADLPPADPEEQEKRIRDWDPVELLVPEWDYLQRDPIGPHQEDPASGLTLSKQDRDPNLPSVITRVLAVERLRKVNALVGFTRIDDMDRVGDLPRRLAPLTRTPRPTWTVATEDRGEGIFTTPSSRTSRTGAPARARSARRGPCAVRAS
jgi:hypothetical protein